ncbi:glycosyltransferase family 39 protein [Nonomuraea recticatena]|uniref:glycosyltransferase family 39 protein n=1 Tax=Nonomuraea recticatena TaxID=46178 RepID=UPI00361D8961
MTLTPTTVAINRDNNPDTILVLLLVAAAWFALEAIRRGRPRALLLCALLVGLGFNTKMLQAYLVVPALALAYVTCAAAPFPRRLGHLLSAGAVLVASSAWWMVIVDLWPTSSRPYVGGSTDNSVWDLVIGYNGLGRIFGRGFGGSGRGGGASFGGESGAGRLFNDTMAGQISWLLPFCALALLLAAATWRTLGARAVAGEDRSAVSALGDCGGLRASRAAWLVWGGWLAVHHVVFSFSSGTFHPYYSTAMAPAVAAVTGMGAVLMWRAYRRSPWWWVLPLAVAATGSWSFVVLRRTPEFVPWLAWAVAAAGVAAVAGLVGARLARGRAAKAAAGAGGAAGARAAAVAVVAALLAGLAGPAAYAVTPCDRRSTAPTRRRAPRRARASVRASARCVAAPARTAGRARWRRHPVRRDRRGAVRGRRQQRADHLPGAEPGDGHLAGRRRQRQAGRPDHPGDRRAGHRDGRLHRQGPRADRPGAQGARRLRPPQVRHGGRRARRSRQGRQRGHRLGAGHLRGGGRPGRPVPLRPLTSAASGAGRMSVSATLGRCDVRTVPEAAGRTRLTSAGPSCWRPRAGSCSNAAWPTPGSPTSPRRSTSAVGSSTTTSPPRTS